MNEKWVLRHCDLDLWPKVTKFNRVRASAVSNHLVKTATKSVRPFGWNFVHKKSGHTDRQTDTHTDKLQWKYNPSTISWRCNENCTSLIPKGNSNYRRKSSAIDLIRRTITRNWHTDTVTHPSTNQGRCWLTRLYQAVDCSSMPITTDIIILIPSNAVNPWLARRSRWNLWTQKWLLNQL